MTAAFTLNLLTRLNRELGTDFDLHQFAHRAHYNAEMGRIETALVSQCAQQVMFEGQPVRFAEGEAMQVEYSCKYAPQDFADMAATAGLRVTRTWTDPNPMVFSGDAATPDVQLAAAHCAVAAMQCTAHKTKPRRGIWAFRNYWAWCCWSGA